MSKVAKWIFPIAGGKDGIIGTAKVVAGVFTGNVGLIFDGVKQVAGAGKKAEGQARQADVLSLKIGEHGREAVIGIACTGGSLVDIFNFGGQYGTDKVTRCIALADHAIDGIVGFYVDDRYYPWVGEGLQAAFSNKLSFHFRNASGLGYDPPQHVQDNSDWSLTDRMVGITHIWIDWTADEKVWPQGHPRLRFVLRGLRVYDPRFDPQFGYTGPSPQVWEDRATHQFSRNAKLLRYAYTRGIYAEGHHGDPNYLLIGRGLSAEEAPPELVIPDANLCDEIADGVARYTADGVILAGQPFIEVDGLFAAAMAGVIVQREGTVDVEAGQAKAVVATITDDDLVLGEPVRFSRFLPDNDGGRVNTVIGRYVEPSLGYQDHSAPVRRSLEDIQADGGPRELTVSLPIVTEAKQVDRVIEIQRLLARLERRATITLPPKFAGLEEGDWIAWQSQRRHGGATVRYRVESYRQPESWRMTLTLREIASSVFGVPDPVEDFVTPPPPPVPIDALQLLGVDAEAITLPGDTSAIPAVRFTWDTPVDASTLAIRGEIRVQGETATAETRTDEIQKGELIATNGVAANQTIEARLVPIGDPSRPVVPSAWRVITTGELVADDTGAVGGRPSTMLLTQVDDLIETYGDTVAASAAAAAAEASRAAAVAAELAAQAAAEDASDFAEDAYSERLLAEAGAGQAGIARDQAVAAQGGAEDAEAAAFDSYTQTSRISLSTLSDNPAFAIFTATGNPGVPDFWTAWDTVNDAVRVPGRFSRWAFQQHNNKDFVLTEGGIAQYAGVDHRGLMNVPPGKYVLSADVRLVAGSLRGAGLLFYTDGASTVIDFATETPVGAAGPAGAGVEGRAYSFTKLVDLPVGGNAVFHVMTGWAGFGSPNEAKILIWDRAFVRPATASEVAAGRADTNAAQALADISIEQTTRAAETAALSARQVTTEARITVIPNLIERGNFPARPGDPNGFGDAWVLESGPGPSTAVDPVVGPYAFIPAGEYIVSKVYPCGAGTFLSIGWNGTADDPLANCYIQAMPSFAFVSGAPRGSGPVDNDWRTRHRSGPVTPTPAGTTGFRVVVAAPSGNMVVSSIKVNFGEAASDFTDERTAADYYARTGIAQDAALDAQAKLAFARLTLVAEASGGRPTRVGIYSDNQGNSDIVLDAARIWFGENTVFDDVTDTLQTVWGSTRRVLALGAPFGTDSTITEWEGPDGTALSAMSRANAFSGRANVAPRVFGSAQPGGQQVTVSPARRTVNAPGSSGNISMGSFTVNTVGLSGPITYSFEPAFDNGIFSVFSQSGATANLRANGAQVGQIYTSTFLVTTTETNTGRQFTNTIYLTLITETLS